MHVHVDHRPRPHVFPRPPTEQHRAQPARVRSPAAIGIPVVAAVINDHAYGAERHFLDLEGFSNVQSLIPDVDFGAVAKGLGIESRTVRSLGDVEAAAGELRSVRHSPLLLDCKITAELRAAWIEEVAAHHPRAEPRPLAPALDRDR